MSAYLVDYATIDAIVTWAKEHRVRYYMTDSYNPTEIAECPELIGHILADANVRSVQHRYESDRTDPRVSGFASDYRFDVFTTPLTAVEVIKLCDCLDYQSCEPEDWEQSEAYFILQQIIRSATRKVEGYEQAPWGLKDRTGSELKHKGAISLSLLAQQTRRPVPRRR